MKVTMMKKKTTMNVNNEAFLFYTLVDVEELIKHIGFAKFQQALDLVLKVRKEAREWTKEEKAFMQALLDDWKH